MDSLWGLRHRGSGLMGAVLDVESGRWVRRESGVGAGIDSYYEYCLKAYILLGNSKYLSRFNKVLYNFTYLFKGFDYFDNLLILIGELYLLNVSFQLRKKYCF